jgi:hypothetical protein
MEGCAGDCDGNPCCSVHAMDRCSVRVPRMMAFIRYTFSYGHLVLLAALDRVYFLSSCLWTDSSCRGAERHRGRWGVCVDGLKRHLPQIEMTKGVAIIKERMKDDDEKGVGPKEESSDHDLHAHAHAHVVRYVLYRILYIYLHGNYSLYPALLYISWRTYRTEPRSHRTQYGIILPPIRDCTVCTFVRTRQPSYCHVPQVRPSNRVKTKAGTWEQNKINKIPHRPSVHKLRWIGTSGRRLIRPSIHRRSSLSVVFSRQLLSGNSHSRFVSRSIPLLPF